jgi:hypothetical protein
MEVVHETEDPGSPIGRSFTESSPDTCSLATACGITSNSVVGKLPLLLAQPASLERTIWKSKGSEDSDAHGERTLDNEQPSRILLDSVLVKS